MSSPGQVRNLAPTSLAQANTHPMGLKQERGKRDRQKQGQLAEHMREERTAERPAGLLFGIPSQGGRGETRLILVHNRSLGELSEDVEAASETTTDQEDQTKDRESGGDKDLTKGTDEPPLDAAQRHCTPFFSVLLDVASPATAGVMEQHCGAASGECPLKHEAAVIASETGADCADNRSAGGAVQLSSGRRKPILCICQKRFGVDGTSVFNGQAGGTETRPLTDTKVTGRTP
ncbi:unnamed protein product [Boreogadus saida]